MKRRRVLPKEEILEKLFGLVIAISVSVIIWFITNDAVTSILVALMTEIIALVLELHIDMARTNKIIADTLSISEATAKYVPLRELVTEYDYLIRNGSSLHTNEAQRGLLEFSELIKDLRRGKIKIPASEAYVRAGQIFDTLKKTALVTDIVKDPYKWSTGDHSLWQETNLKYAKKGLKITRIFIIKDKDFLKPEFPLINTMKEQSKSGISVYYVVFDELEPELIRDGALLDDKIVITSLFTPAGEFGLFTLETSKTLVEDTRRYFERIFSRAHSFDSLESHYHS